MKNPQLIYEANIYKKLKGFEGFAKAYYFDKDNDNHILVVSLLGESLDSISKRKVLSLETILQVGIQMIDRVEALHKVGFLHWDIKPDNFCIGKGSKNDIIYCIDFGLSKAFTDKTGNHIKLISGKSLIGTARYSSIWAHQGYEQGRWDDLESVGYVLLYLIRGNLPWQGIHHNDQKKKFELILNKKETTTKDELCGDVKGGDSFWEFLEICKETEFEHAPDYEKLRSILRIILEEFCTPLWGYFVEW